MKTQFRLLIASAGLLVLGAMGQVIGAEPAAEPAAAPPVQSVAPDYLIGPGDTLQISEWQTPEMTRTVPVRPDGKISLPFVENVVAVGKTPSQLSRDIEAVRISVPQVRRFSSVPRAVIEACSVGPPVV